MSAIIYFPPKDGNGAIGTRDWNIPEGGLGFLADQGYLLKLANSGLLRRVEIADPLPPSLSKGMANGPNLMNSSHKEMEELSQQDPQSGLDYYAKLQEKRDSTPSSPEPVGVKEPSDEDLASIIDTVRNSAPQASENEQVDLVNAILREQGYFNTSVDSMTPLDDDKEEEKSIAEEPIWPPVNQDTNPESTDNSQSTDTKSTDDSQDTQPSLPLEDKPETPPQGEARYAASDLLSEEWSYREVQLYAKSKGVNAKGSQEKIVESLVNAGVVYE